MSAKKPSRSRDPLEVQIEAALEPGRFVGDRGCFRFVEDLDLVEDKLVLVVPTEPARAVALYEAFLAGCYEKAEELDDSSGSFGMFVEDLFCGWVNARQGAGASAEETASLLLGWMDDEDYGFCFGLERKIGKVLDKPGLAALVGQVRKRFDAPGDPSDTTTGRSTSYRHRRWGDVLRALHVAQRDVDAYIQLAEETGLTAKDCLAVATMLKAKRKREDALSWVERGTGIEKRGASSSFAGHELAELKRQLLVKLGRDDEALASAWAGFVDHPSQYSFEDLMKFVPKEDRSAWHGKAMDAAMKTDLSSLIGLLVKTKEAERLSEIVSNASDAKLERVGHYTMEPAAAMLEKNHPDTAARVWKAMGMCVVNAGKSKYYGASLRNFERAKRCYGKAGLDTDWEAVVNEVRSAHGRRSSFMPGFEEIVAGAGPSTEPPFLDRAKARWDGRSSRSE